MMMVTAMTCVKEETVCRVLSTAADLIVLEALGGFGRLISLDEHRAEPKGASAKR
jgi:hypothetical protein